MSIFAFGAFVERTEQTFVYLSHYEVSSQIIILHMSALIMETRCTCDVGPLCLALLTWINHFQTLALLLFPTYLCLVFYYLVPRDLETSLTDDCSFTLTLSTEEQSLLLIGSSGIEEKNDHGRSPFPSSSSISPGPKSIAFLIIRWNFNLWHKEPKLI